MDFVLEKTKWIKIDMAAKRHKKHKNQNSGLVISMGYDTEIQEFWLFTRLSTLTRKENEAVMLWGYLRKNILPKTLDIIM